MQYQKQQQLYLQMIMNTHQHLFCGPSPLVKQDQWPVSIQCTKLSTGVGTNLDKSTEKKKKISHRTSNYTHTAYSFWLEHFPKY